jgi:hypothetical protein
MKSKANLRLRTTLGELIGAIMDAALEVSAMSVRHIILPVLF